MDHAKDKIIFQTTEVGGLFGTFRRTHQTSGQLVVRKRSCTTKVIEERLGKKMLITVASLTAIITTGSRDRPFPSCLYARSRNFPLDVGNKHSATNLVVVLSPALVGSSLVTRSVAPASALVSSMPEATLHSDRGPLEPKECRHTPVRG